MPGERVGYGSRLNAGSRLPGTRISLAILSAFALQVACASAVAAESPGKLRTEMARAEREFFDLYNKANTNPEFAIVCKMETPTGTNFAVRVCRPRYLITANAESASERMQAAIAAGNATGPNANGPNVGAGVAAGGGDAVADKDKAFKQNMLDVMQKSPELQALGKKRDELQTRYDDVMKGKSGR
jgi:hypothetical protein